MSERSGLDDSRDLKCRRQDFRFKGYTPVIGGVSWPVVFGHQVDVSAAATSEIIPAESFPYLSGQQILLNNSGSNTVTIEFYDGDPGGSDFDLLFSSGTIATNGRAVWELAGTVLCIKRGLWMVVTGTTPDATIALLVNY